MSTPAEVATWVAALVRVEAPVDEGDDGAWDVADDATWQLSAAASEAGPGGEAARTAVVAWARLWRGRRRESSIALLTGLRAPFHDEITALLSEVVSADPDGPVQYVALTRLVEADRVRGLEAARALAATPVGEASRAATRVLVEAGEPGIRERVPEHEVAAYALVEGHEPWAACAARWQARGLAPVDVVERFVAAGVARPPADALAEVVGAWDLAYSASELVALLLRPAWVSLDLADGASAEPPAVAALLSGAGVAGVVVAPAGGGDPGWLDVADLGGRLERTLTASGHDLRLVSFPTGGVVGELALVPPAVLPVLDDLQVPSA